MQRKNPTLYKQTSYTVVEMMKDRIQTPTAPPEFLQTPVNKFRLYPKLTTPRLMSGKKKIQRQKTPVPYSTERRSPHIDPQYWAPLLKKKIFHHISEFRPPRSHIVDPTDVKPESPTFPTLKKLKKCGQYILKWRGEAEPSKIDYSIQGSVIPTVAGGVSVIFKDIESVSRKFESFQ